MRRRFTSVVLFALVLVQVFSVFANTYQVVAVGNSTTESIKPGRDANEEYYYYDKEDIYGVGGRYVDPVKFVKKYGDTIYVPGGSSIKFDKVKEEADQCESDDAPVKLWDTAKKEATEDPAMFLNIGPQGTLELDLKDDGEDGYFRWGKIAENPLSRIKNYDKNFPDTVTGGSVSQDQVGKLFKRTQVSLSNTDFNCRYQYFKHFNRLIAPYDDDSLEPGPVAGRVIGRQGVAFDDYVKKADNRLRFRAYAQSAREQTFDHCNRLSEIYKCIIAVDKQFQTCYSDSISAAGANLSQDAEDVMSNTWEKEFDPEKFIKCFEDAPTLINAPSKYFGDKNELKDFAQAIVDGAILPPSLKPIEPDEVGRIEAGDETQCSIGMLGWILCPVFSFIASVNDKIFDILKNWLVLAPFQQGVGGSNAAAYDVWSKLRNIVNAFFILFFVIIIYSQITGKGVSTYGIRSLLPRVIIGALLINLSYLICSVAVDISNTLGDSVYRLMSGMTIAGSTIGSGATDGGWENVTASLILGGGAIAGTLVLIANLSALVPIMVMAFIALVTTFLVLLFRQALIIILVVASPLAFLLFVLPGTASWFSKWRTMFIQLLLLYPAFALIFAGSQIAAEIVRDTAAVNGDSLLVIFSLGIQVIPLFLLPIIMKLGGGVLNRFGGIINNPNKGPFDRMKNRADEFRKDRKTQQQTRALNGRKGAFGYGALIRASQRSKAKRQYHAQNARRATSGYTGENSESILRSALGSHASKDLKDQLRDVMRDTINKELRDEYEAAVVSIENSDLSLSNEELAKMATAAGSHAEIPEAEQAAAMDKIMKNGDVGEIDSMLDAVHASQAEITDLQREVLMKTSAGVSGGAAHLSAANIDQTLARGVAPGQSLSQALYANAALQGSYTPEALAVQDAESIKGLSESISGTQLDTVRQNFSAAKNDTKLSGRMTAATREAGESYL